MDADILRDRFEEIKSLPAFESIPVKLDATPGDIAWVEARELEFPELRVEQQPQRRYPPNGLLAHVLGYVGRDRSRTVETAHYREKGLKPGDVMGQSGLEQSYDEFLRGRDGYRKVVVDSRGRIQDEIEMVPPQPGQDMITTIDLDLQMAAEEQLRDFSNKTGRDRRHGSEQWRSSGARFRANLRSRIFSPSALAPKEDGLSMWRCSTIRTSR